MKKPSLMLYPGGLSTFFALAGDGLRERAQGMNADEINVMEGQLQLAGHSLGIMLELMGGGHMCDASDGITTDKLAATLYTAGMMIQEMASMHEILSIARNRLDGQVENHAEHCNF